MTHFIKIAATGKPARVTAKTHAAVVDPRTGLMWSAADIGQPTTFKDATDRCAALAHASFTDWRLPTLQELFTIADHSRHAPAIDTGAFPTCKGGWYWSSTVDASSPSGCAWVVNFGDGNAIYDHQVNDGRVRAVRSVSSSASGQ